jgi:hypothetical protein
VPVWYESQARQQKGSRGCLLVFALIELYRSALAFRRWLALVLLLEPFDAAGGIEDFLLAGIERVAFGAHLDVQIVVERRTRLELVAATANDVNFLIFWMNFIFHGGS